MFSGLGYLWRAYIYCRSLFLSLYSRFFFLFCEEGNMETETERLTGGCRHKRKVGRKRVKDGGWGGGGGGERTSSRDKLEDHCFLCTPPVKLPSQAECMCTHTHIHTLLHFSPPLSTTPPSLSVSIHPLAAAAGSPGR